MAAIGGEPGANSRDVRRIAGHADLGTTERYVEPSLETKRRLIALTSRARGSCRPRGSSGRCLEPPDPIREYPRRPAIVFIIFEDTLLNRLTSRP